MKGRWLSAVATVLFGAGAFAAASRFTIPSPLPYDVHLLPPAQVLHWTSFGHPTLLGNLLWLRAVQYMGDPEAGKRGWDRLYPLVDLLTDLDPGHDYAYQVTGTVLSSLGRIKESDAILEKGMKNVPYYWILWFLRAFNAFYDEGDYALAGHYLQQASEIPGAPEHLRDNMLAMYVKGKQTEAAIRFLTTIRDQTTDPATRELVQARLNQAILERDAAHIEEALSAYEKKRGGPPARLEDLVTAGFLDALPPDPFGGHYELFPDGRVHSSAHPFRYEPGLTPEQLRRDSRDLRNAIHPVNP